MSDAIARIEALLARAAHENTPEEEARTCAHIAAKEIKKKGLTVRPGSSDDGWRERAIQELRKAGNLIRDLKERVAEAERRAEAAESRAGKREPHPDSVEARRDKHHGAERPAPGAYEPPKNRRKRPINY